MLFNGSILKGKKKRETVDMKSGEIYLDNNASSRVLPGVAEKVAEVLALTGNASSPHSCGREIRREVEEARKLFAAFIGADAEEIVFTSSGTEANNMALVSAVAGVKKPKVVTTVVEHSSVKKMCSRLEIDGAEVARVGVGGGGIVDMEEMEKQIASGAAIVSVQWVNNETGVIQDVETIAAMCREKGVAFHTDAAQAPGKMPVDSRALGADFATFTGHKFNALAGCGAVFVKDRLMLGQMMFGGFQEGGFRPGTENVAGIAAMGKAAEIRAADVEDTARRLAEMRDFFEKTVLESVAGTSVNGDPERRVPNTANIVFRETDGEKMVAVLDSLGLKCSQSSACTSSDPSPSYVLTAMGLSGEDAKSSVRFSFGVDNKMEDARTAAELVARACAECGRQ